MNVKNTLFLLGLYKKVKKTTSTAVVMSYDIQTKQTKLERKEINRIILP